MTVADVVIHFIIGLVGLGTGWGIRAACAHTGLVPHPKWQVPLALVLVLAEAIIGVRIAG
jgi:hypothetical protein